MFCIRLLDHYDTGEGDRVYVERGDDVKGAILEPNGERSNMAQIMLQDRMSIKLLDHNNA